MVLAAPPADPRRVAADLITQAEHGPDSPAILVTTDAAFADAVEAAVDEQLATRGAARHPRARAARRTAGSPSPRPRRGDRLHQRLRPRAPLGRRRAARADRRAPAQRRLAVRRPVGARIGRRLRDGRQPRPADRRSRPRLRRSGGRGVRQVRPGPAGRPRGPRHIRDTVDDAGRGGGPARSPRRGRDPLRGTPTAMSPTPVTFQSPDRARRRTAGRRPTRRSPRATASIARRSSGSTSTPPRPRRTSSPDLLAAGRFEAPLSEYPPTDYRRLVEAAAARYGVDARRDPRRRRRRRDPRHRRQGVHPGRRSRRRPGPDVRDVPGPDRAARRDGRRRPAARAATLGYALDLPATRRGRAREDAAVVWLCSPNNPTALAEPDGTIEALLRRHSTTTPPRPGARHRSSSSTRPMPSSSAPRCSRCATPTRTSSSSAPPARPTRSPVCGSGSRIARPEMIARLNPFRPPGSVSTVSVTLVTEALARPAILAGEPRARRPRACPADRRAPRDRLARRAVRHELHPRRISVRPSAPARSPNG